MRKCANCNFAVQMLFFCSRNDIFGVQSNMLGVQKKNFSTQYKLLLPFGKSFVFQEKKFERVVQTFVALLREFCCLLVWVLRFLPSNVKFLKRSTKVCCIFLGGGPGGGVKAFLWTACCCQKEVEEIIMERTKEQFFYPEMSIVFSVLTRAWKKRKPLKSYEGLR